MTGSDEAETAESSRPVKSEAAFRTISEVSEELNVPQHVLRFWESKFSQIRPLKRGGGRRYYRPEDIAILVRIRDLLYRDGYTIRGAQKYLRETGRGNGTRKAAHEVTPVTEETLPVEIPSSSPSSEQPSVAVEQEDGASVPAVPSAEVRAELESVLEELLELRALLADARDSAGA